MYCPNCGNETRGKFCTSCGARVDDAGSDVEASGDPAATSAFRPEDIRAMESRQPAHTATPLSGAADPMATSAFRQDDMGSNYGPASGSPPVESSSAGSNWKRELGIGGAPFGSNPSRGSGQESTAGGRFDVRKYVPMLDQLGAQNLAWIGAALLLIGDFLPTKTISVLGFSASAKLWDYAGFWGIIFLLCAIASAAVAYLKDYKWLWITGGIALIGVVLEFIDALTASYSHPSWGFIFLFLGAAAIIVAAAMTSTIQQVVSEVQARVNAQR